MDNSSNIDILVFVRILWSKKFSIALIIGCSVLVSIYYALSIPNLYSAHAIVIPTKLSSDSASRAVRRMGGIAALAGVNIDVDNKDESVVALQIMKSQSFIVDFVQSNGLEKAVMAGKRWIYETDEIVLDESLYNSESQKWLFKDSISGLPGAPSSWTIFQRFTDMLSISEDRVTGMITIELEYVSPRLAKTWVNMYVEAINEHMRERKLSQVNRNIQYLEKQIDSTSITEMQEVFYFIIEEETKTKMLAEATPEYSFTTVSHTMLPEVKSYPNRALICVLGALFGCLLAFFWALLPHLFRSDG